MRIKERREEILHLCLPQIFVHCVVDLKETRAVCSLAYLGFLGVQRGFVVALLEQNIVGRFEKLPGSFFRATVRPCTVWAVNAWNVCEVEGA